MSEQQQQQLQQQQDNYYAGKDGELVHTCQTASSCENNCISQTVLLDNMPNDLTVTAKVIPGDGDCQFETISQTLAKKNIFYSKFELRETAVRILGENRILITDRDDLRRSNREGVSYSIRETEEEYLARMSNQGEYGDDCTLRAFVVFLDTPIHVFRFSDRAKTFSTVINPRVTTSQPLLIAHVNENHFEMIVPIDELVAMVIFLFLVFLDIELFYIFQATSNLTASVEIGTAGFLEVIFFFHLFFHCNIYVHFSPIFFHYIFHFFPFFSHLF